MDNLSRWRFFCQEIKSPDLFIDWGLYSLIASSLQRRVWRGTETMPIFPNLFIIFVADPGIGKGLVIDRIDAMLRFHKLTKEDEKTKPNPAGRSS